MINGQSITVSGTSSESEPSFKTLLSQGDKNTLAFAFFLSRLDLDDNLANKIIIFDDPISSLDHHRRRCTQQQISRIARTAKQVIVLSHDPYFLKMIWDHAQRASTRTFNILRSPDTSKLDAWDIVRATQGEYFRDYYTLSDYVHDGPEGKDLRAIARCIRPVLEGNLRMRFPNAFLPGEWLGDFLTKIRAAQPEDLLSSLHNQYEELDNINGYSKRYHHNENPNADTEPINDNELKAFVNRTLAVISGNSQ